MAEATSDRTGSMPGHRREPDAMFEGFEHRRIESNREVLGEAWGDLAPAHVGERLAVQEQQRRPVAALAKIDDDTVERCVRWARRHKLHGRHD